MLGKVEGVEGGVLAREMMVGYFVDKNPNSPKVSFFLFRTKRSGRSNDGWKALDLRADFARCSFFWRGTFQRCEIPLGRLWVYSRSFYVDLPMRSMLAELSQHASKFIRGSLRFETPLL